jgi:hypothetical protein
MRIGESGSQPGALAGAAGTQEEKTLSRNGEDSRQHRLTTFLSNFIEI